MHVVMVEVSFPTSLEVHMTGEHAESDVRGKETGKASVRHW